VIDLRSDTVTRPSSAMLEAMRRAPLGDDVFGDDPTTSKLEERAAELTGMEAALFTPSGTMANAIAIALSTRPGDEMIVADDAHSFQFECGGAARLWGVQSRALPAPRGQIPLAAIESAIRPLDIHLPVSKLVVLEQTSNLAGGVVLPFDYVQAVSNLCRSRGMRLHIDGARIFNAAVASGVPVATWAGLADTLMFCASKGLGAPAGSILVGSADGIREARRTRKLLGGGLRQAGILAAAALYALEHHVVDLVRDHARAADFARSLAELGDSALDVPVPETNMVYVRWTGGKAADYRALVDRIRADGVLAIALFDRGIRFVFHRDIDDAAARRAAAIVREALLGRDQHRKSL
jgi:threonine aldolase